MYQSGFYEAYEANVGFEAYAGRVFKLYVDGKPENAESITVSREDVQWAARHFHIAADFAKLLDNFRLHFERNETLPFAEVKELLDGITKGFRDAASGPQAVLPIMLLDEMVRRSSPGVTGARETLLEVTLFDPDNADEPLHYIPIPG